MKRTSCTVLAATLLFIGISAAQSSTQSQSSGPASPTSAAAAQSGTEARFAPGAKLVVELDKTIDTKKAKAGDPVVVKTMEDIMDDTHVVAPRGAKIFGHVVQAAPHTGETPSSLEIAFDKMELGKGHEVPLKATVQALARPISSFAGTDAMGGGAVPGGPPTMGPGAGSRVGGISPGSMGQPTGAPYPGGNTGNPAGTPGGAPTTRGGGLSPDAHGVIGISGVALSTGPNANSVISSTSPKHNVKLESGTQMVLSTE